MPKQLSKFSTGLFGLILLELFILVNAISVRWLLPDYAFYDIRRIVQLAIFGTTTLMLLTDFSVRELSLSIFQKLPIYSRIALLAFFGLGLISACFAALPQFALLEWATALMILITGLNFACMRFSLVQSFDRVMTYAIIIAIGCYSMLVIATLLIIACRPYTALSPMSLFYLLAAPTFNNPRFLTQFMSWTLPLIVLPNLVYSSKFKSVRYALFALSAYWWCLVLVGQSRALELGSITTAILLIAMFGKYAKSYMLHQLWAAIAGIILYFLLYQGLVHLPLRNLSLLDPDNRMQIWTVAIHLIKAHPLLGVGPLHFPYYAYAQEQLVAHPHNAILLIGCEWGIPAALLAISLVGWGILRWINFARQQVKLPAACVNPNLLIGLSGSLVLAGINCMFSGTLVMPLSQIMFAVIVGWVISIYFSDKPKIISSKLAHSGIIVLLAVCVGLLVLGIAPVVSHVPQMDATYMASCNVVDCSNSPYYWMQGWIQFYPNSIL
ncbi:MAG: hypothetical protein K0Q57_377 [Gammaproteobacteria bacterium]|jgi:hypothetical protein|nr:hypothetical protein [Gammaproteobacteria bacterium]